MVICFAVWCGITRGVAGMASYRMVLYGTACYCMVLHGIVWCGMLWYGIVLYCIVLYCIVLYCIVLYCIVCYCTLWCIKVEILIFEILSFFVRKFLQAKFMGKTGLVSFDSHNTRHGSNYGVFQLVHLSNITGWLEIGMWRNGAFDTRLMSWIVHEVSKITLPLLRISTKKNKPWVFLTTNEVIDSRTSQCFIGIRCINYTTYVNEWNNTFEEHCCTGNMNVKGREQ